MNQLKTRALALALAGVAATVVSRPALASTLRGSHASMVHQHAIAVDLDYSFARTPAQLRALVADSALQRVSSTSDLELRGVSYPFARPAVRDFVEWLAAEYHAAIGAPLVVTSLARPTSRQPRNASPLSVHPAGMAVDLRIPASASALRWLEQKLLSLEQAGVVDVTRERHPPHLHVAVFPEQYAAFAAEHAPQETASAPKLAPSVPSILQSPAVSSASDAANGMFAAAVGGGSLGLLLFVAVVIATMVRRAARST